MKKFFYYILVAIIGVLCAFGAYKVKDLKLRKEVAAFYNDNQKQCDVVGTTQNYIFVSRYDTDNKPIINSKWEVQDESKKIVGTFLTNNNGNGGLVGLDYGKYYLQEISVPEGNKLNKEKYEFVISRTDKVYNLIKTDSEKRGHIIINVKDKDNNPVKDLTYIVYDKNNDEVIRINTNSDGNAGVKNLPLGTYYIKENKQNSETLTAEVKEDSTPVLLNVIYNN